MMKALQVVGGDRCPHAGTKPDVRTLTEVLQVECNFVLLFLHGNYCRIKEYSVDFLIVPKVTLYYWISYVGGTVLYSFACLLLGLIYTCRHG